jgi:hypothetical protein
MSLPPTHPNTKKDYYALLKPNPPVKFLPLLLHLLHLFTSGEEIWEIGLLHILK